LLLQEVETDQFIDTCCKTVSSTFDKRFME